MKEREKKNIGQENGNTEKDQTARALMGLKRGTKKGEEAKT